MGTLAKNGLVEDADLPQPAFTCPKLTIETLEQGMKYVQNYQ